MTQPQQGQAPAAQPPAAFLWRWVGRSLLALLTVRYGLVAFNTIYNSGSSAQQGQGSSSATAAHQQQQQQHQQQRQVYYFYNEATGQVQWEDPGEVPFEDESGLRYWALPDGSKTFEDPSFGKYAWVEQYSSELQRPFFYNQETKESSWERPADLSWRRVAVLEEE